MRQAGPGAIGWKEQLLLVLAVVGLVSLVAACANEGRTDDSHEVGVRDIGGSEDTDNGGTTTDTRPGDDPVDSTGDDTVDLPEDRDGEDADGSADPDADDSGGGDAGEEPAGPATFCGRNDSDFPEPARSCSQDSDCMVVLHQVDTCVTERALGISRSGQSVFETNEAICRANFTRDRCPAGLTFADDGNALTSLEDVVVRCEEAQCRSTVPSPPEMVCRGMRVSIFPEFERACSDVRECVIVEHQLNCCGRIHLMGIAASAVAAFEAAELECRDTLDAGCTCEAGDHATDSGYNAPDISEVELLCLSGRCWTRGPEPTWDD